MGCVYAGKRNPIPQKERLAQSLRVFLDCAEKSREGGYFMGFKAYEVWACDLRDDAFYESCGEDQFARRFSVDQFCALSLLDARSAARGYIGAMSALFDIPELTCIAERFASIADKAEAINRMLDSGEALSGDCCRAFWTAGKRHAQAALLDEISALERDAHALASRVIERLG